MNVSLSGLSAAETRISTSANNIANINTVSSPDEKGFVPAEVQQVSTPNGGTQALVRPISPPSVSEYSPSSPVADSKGFVNAPNVDLATEQVNQILGRNAFDANLKALSAYNKTVETVLDIVG